jgi:hypothetical protein
VPSAIDDQAEYPGRVFKLATFGAAEIGAHSAGFNVNVMAGAGVAERSCEHAVDVADLEAARHDLLVVGIDAAELQHARWTGAIDDLRCMRIDDLEELPDRHLVDLRGHVILPPSW